MKLFAQEGKRVAPVYFVQTPNFWFPLEPHCMAPFFHWLPESLRVSLVIRYNLGHWPRAESIEEAAGIVDGANLLERKRFQALFDDAEIIAERYFGLTKSFVAFRRGR